MVRGLFPLAALITRAVRFYREIGDNCRAPWRRRARSSHARGVMARITKAPPPPSPPFVCFSWLFCFFACLDFPFSFLFDILFNRNTQMRPLFPAKTKSNLHLASLPDSVILAVCFFSFLTLLLILPAHSLPMTNIRQTWRPADVCPRVDLLSFNCWITKYLNYPITCWTRWCARLASSVVKARLLSSKMAARWRFKTGVGLAPVLDFGSRGFLLI